LKIWQYKVNNLNKKLSKKYEDIVIPDRKLNEIRKNLWDIGQKPLILFAEYLNWDKYLLIQAILKTINKENWEQVLIYLDGALSRIDWLLHTISKYIKDDNKVDVDSDIF
jgi:hypothetical protein